MEGFKNIEIKSFRGIDYLKVDDISRVNVFLGHKKDTVLALLKLFNERINGIEILTDDVYFGFEGMAEMLPARVTGDGLRRYLSIVASAANPMIDMFVTTHCKEDSRSS